jgi:phosphohistidine phosphatase
MLARTLYVLRHAKSSWDDPGLVDHDRPLSNRGRGATAVMLDHFTGEGIKPDFVLCSSALRARQTLEGVLPALGEPAVSVERELYGAYADYLLGRIARVPESSTSVLLIGHNPGLQDLVVLVAESGDVDEVRTKFPTAALATLVLRGAWSDLGPGQAHLSAYVTPKGLKGRRN